MLENPCLSALPDAFEQQGLSPFSNMTQYSTSIEKCKSLPQKSIEICKKNQQTSIKSKAKPKKGNEMDIVYKKVKKPLGVRG